MRDGLGLLVGVVGMGSCGRHVWLRFWYRASRGVSGSVCREWERVDGTGGWIRRLLRDGGGKKRSCEAEVWERARVLRRSRAHADGCGCGLVHTVVSGHAEGGWSATALESWNPKMAGCWESRRLVEERKREHRSRVKSGERGPARGGGRETEVEVAVMCCTTRLWLAVG